MNISLNNWEVETYPVLTEVLVDGMDKAYDSVGSIGKIRDGRECIEAHSMHLIALLPAASKQPHKHTQF